MGKDYLHNPDILADKMMDNNHRLLPYPTHDLQVGDHICQVYEIPDDDLQSVLSEINPLPNCVVLDKDDLYFDLNKGEKFYLYEAMIIRFENTNHIVSPWFVEYGSSFKWCAKWNRRLKKGFGPL